MNADRLMVAQAVLEGKIGSEYLSEKEADELACRVVDMAMDIEIDKAAERGCVVFYGFEQEQVH